MNHLSNSVDRYRDKPQTVIKMIMETTMNPFSTLKSSSLWIGALALGVSLSIGCAPAMAKKQSQWQQKQQQTPKNGPGDKLKGGGQGPDHKILNIQFIKYVGQKSCKYIESKTILAVKGSPGFWNNPNGAHVKEFTDTKLIFEDQLPKGLKWISGEVSGDLDVKPPVEFTNDVFANDTLKVVKAQLSATENLADGLNGADTRFFVVNGVAEIDPAQFPNPISVESQARLTIITPFNIENAKSNDGGAPAPADWKDGTPSKLHIDLSDCDEPEDGGEPEGDPDGEPCIKFEKGEVECHGGAIVPFTYKMPVSPALAGQTIELTSLTPGVIVNPAFQIVPPGGGVLEWDLLGAAKGMTIHLLTNNVKQVGPADFDGLATCCTEEIIIDIPEDIPCDEDEKEPDLEVTKDALVPVCDKNDGDCKFRIRVKNVGDKKFDGTLALQEWQIPHRSFIDNGPNAPWSCNYDLGLALYICKHPALTLNPGEFKDLNLSFKPGNAWPSDKIKNCAKLDYPEMGVAPFGDLTNDKDCAEICIKGSPECPDEDDEKKPELEIRKFDAGTKCISNAQGLVVCGVSYSIIIHNFGDGDYNGPLNVTDHFDVKPDNVTFTPIPPWICLTVDGQNFDCSHPGINIPANGQTILNVVASFNNPDELDQKEIENCVDLKQGVDGKEKDCAIGKLPDPGSDDPTHPGKPDLSIEKSCKPGVLGGLISCRISVRNNGDRPPIGIVRVFDVARVLGTDAPLIAQDVTPDGPEWQCEGAPANDLACAINGEHLTPGTVRYFEAKIKISQKGNERYRNCATGHHEPLIGQDSAMFGQSCVEGGVDIKVEKTGAAQCELGEPCVFDVTIKNVGESDFQGPVQIADALGLAGAGMSVPITSISPPLPCAAQPTSVPFACSGELNLAAGESTTHKITLVFDEETKVDEGADLRNCAVVVDGEISTAGAKAKGENDNDAQTSGLIGCHPFKIGNVKEDQCTAPMVMNDAGSCVCPTGTTWNGRRCIGPGTSVPPVRTPDPLCVPGKGEIRTNDNRCICRADYVRKGPDLCVPPSRGCTPGTNEYKNRKGQCVCKLGYQRNSSGICYKPETCKPGRNEVKTQSGKCVCRSGYQRSSSGYCVKKPTICTLGKNEFRNSQGQCVCKLGYQRNNKGVCYKSDTCKPGRNEIKNKYGKCVCKSGYQRGKGGYCVKKPALCTLGKNEFRNSQGQCVCKLGYSKRSSGVCVKNPTGCKPGPNEYKNSKGQCVCQRGYKRNKKGVCAKDKPTCSGPHKVYNTYLQKCVCSTGYLTDKNGRCYKAPVSTPKPPCYNGKLANIKGRGWYCSCAKNTIRKPIGKKGGASCVKKPVVTKKPDCINGSLLKRGKGWYCKCPANYNRKAYSNGGAYCSKKPVVTKKPDCINGSLLKRGKGWYCKCPANYKRKAYSNGGAYCSKKVVTSTPKPPCYGGRLSKRGKGWYCSCGNSKIRKAIGSKGGARCVKKPVIIYKPKPKKPVIKYIPKKPVIKYKPKKPVIKYKPIKLPCPKGKFRASNGKCYTIPK